MESHAATLVTVLVTIFALFEDDIKRLVGCNPGVALFSRCEDEIAALRMRESPRHSPHFCRARRLKPTNTFSGRLSSASHTSRLRSVRYARLA